MKDINIHDVKLVDVPLSDRYDTHIRYANKIRELVGFPSALAMICCAALRAHRRQTSGKANKWLPRTAYIFDQLKRKEEVEALRQVYGKSFCLISIVSDKATRLETLTKKIMEDDAASRPTNEHEKAAKELMKRDEAEEDDPNGQRMRDAFSLADLFINIDEKAGAEKLVRRFLHALFGSNKISPTRDEYGMYLAKTASLRSLDLSRQVGAAIMSHDAEIISLGCNEVPKSGGGTYWVDDENDQRDYKNGHDENERIKRALLADIVQRLVRSGLVGTTEISAELIQSVVKESIKKGSILRDAQLMDLLEFGRIIHAEMCAICDSSRLGKSTKGAKLYCTTFPCHMCAKHIVAAGISDVYFVEPYPKSYTEQLHSDSVIVTTKTMEHDTRVEFRPFIGIAPARYRDLFERSKRKNDSGEFSDWISGMDRSKAAPNLKLTVASYLDNETAFVKIFKDAILWADGNVILEGKLRDEATPDGS